MVPDEKFRGIFLWLSKSPIVIPEMLIYTFTKRSPPMEQIIKALSAKLNLPESAVRAGLGILLNYIQKEAKGSQFEQLLSALTASSEVMAAAPSGGEPASSDDLLGSLLQNAGNLLGGKVGETTEVLGALNQAGIPLEKIGELAGGFFSEAKNAAGDDVVNGILDQSASLQALKDTFTR